MSVYLIDHYIEDRREFFRRAFITLGFNGIEGDYAEFGCHSGRTFNLAYQEYQKATKHMSFLSYKMRRHFWALDSFKGLPGARGPEDSHPFWIEGTLAMSRDEFVAACASNGISPAEYDIVEGYYEDSLTRQEGLPSEIALAYIDCDMYNSIREVLRFLESRLRHGMMLALDDYFVYSRDQASGARRAVVELFRNSSEWRLLPYFQFAWGGQSFVLESKRILPD
jgi:O-methyltransferase